MNDSNEQKVLYDNLTKQLEFETIDPGNTITKNTVIGLFKKAKLGDVLQAKEFMVEDIIVEEIAANDKAGIRLESIFGKSFRINPSDQLFILDGSK